MKKSKIVILTAAIALFASGCGFSTGGEDSTVSVINATPTPTPEPTATPEPTPEATPTPVPTMTQTGSGVNIIQQTGVYYATTDINLRADCSTEATWLANITTGTALNSTGVSEDGQWIEVNVDGTVGYVSAQYTTTDPAAVSADAAATTDAAAADATAVQ